MRRCFTRQARPALLWGLILSIAAQVLLALLVHRWCPELRDPFYGYKAANLQRRLAEVPRPGPIVVMIGSSRTTFGFEASHLETMLRAQLGLPAVAFNFGIFGGGPVTELLTLRRLLADGIRPDLLLVEVLPALVNSEDAPFEANWLPPHRLRREEIPFLSRYQFDEERLRRDWLSGLWRPAHTYRFAVLSRVCPAWLPAAFRQDWGRADDASGWSGAARVPASSAEYQQGVQRACQEYFEHLQDGMAFGVVQRSWGPGSQALVDLLALAQQEGIPTAMVTMPEGTQYRSWYSQWAHYRINTFLTHTSLERGIPFIDARTWIADAGFADSHHLIAAGARAFTERLGRDYLIPYFRGHGGPYLPGDPDRALPP